VPCPWRILGTKVETKRKGKRNWGGKHWVPRIRPSKSRGGDEQGKTHNAKKKRKKKHRETISRKLMKKKRVSDWKTLTRVVAEHRQIAKQSNLLRTKKKPRARKRKNRHL